jgi:hypothetical protein
MTEAKSELQSSHVRRPPVLTTRNLSVVVTGIVLIVALLKADPKDIPEIIKTLVGSSSFAVIGWTLAMVFLLGAIGAVSLVVFLHGKEIDRLAKERDSLQGKLLEQVTP